MKLKNRIAAVISAAVIFAGALPLNVYAETEAPAEGTAPAESTPEEAPAPYLGAGAFSGGYTCGVPVVNKDSPFDITVYTYIPIENYDPDNKPSVWDMYGYNVFALAGTDCGFSFSSYNAIGTDLSLVGSFLCATTKFVSVKYTGGENILKYSICYVSGNQSASVPISVNVTECEKKEEEKEEAPAASFALSSGGSCTVKAGGSATVNVSLKRLNNGVFSSVAATLSSPDGAILVEETGAKTSNSSSPSFSFRISSPKTAAAGSYNLTLSVSVFGRDGKLTSGDTYSIPVTVTSDVISSGLTVSSYKISKEPVKDGDKFTLKLTLENKCNIDLQDVKVSLSGLDGSKFVLNGGFSSKSVSIKSGSQGTVSFELVACSGISSVRESIPVTAEYRINPADASTAQTLTTSVIAECQPEGEKQDAGKYDITMTGYSFSSNEIRAGTKFTFKFTLKNVSKNDIKDARVSLSELNGGKFALDTGLSYSGFSLKSGAERSFSFTLIGCDGISSIRETIPIEISFGQQTSTVYATASCAPSEQKKEQDYGKYDISMTDYSVSSDAVKSGTKFTLDVTLKNSSAHDINGARVSVSELGSGKFAIDSGLSYFDFDIKAGESKSISFPLVGCDGIASIRETIPLEISFGQQVSTVYATVSCVPDKKPEDENGEVFAPAIIIESYEFGGDHVTGGTIFPLNITIKNTGSSAVIENLKVTISGGPGNGNNGIAFSPANSSNSFFIEQLSPKASEQISIDLLPRADANPDSYPVIVEFDYEYIVNGKRAKAAAASETLTIPLQQEDRFTINHPDYPETAGAGEMAYISVSFVNKGKSDVYNVTADFEGEGFSKTSGAYYIGNVASGSEEYYDVQITPFEEGDLNGEIVVTYEDANGNQKEQRVPVHMNVISYNYGGMYGGFYDDPGMMGGEVDLGEEENGGGLTWLWFVIGGAVVLIVVIIIIVAAVKRKKRRELEADDED